MQFAVEAIPALLHISIFLFLIGLVISLFATHHTVAYITLFATAVFSLVYTAITVMPVIYHDSPYTTPFSAPAWYISRMTAVAVLNAFDWVVNFLRQCKGWSASSGSAARNMMAFSPPRGDNDNDQSHRLLLSMSMTEDIYQTAKRPDPQRDSNALGWTLDQLLEDDELVNFAAGIPGFIKSIEVKESVTILKNALSASRLYPNLDRRIVTLLFRAFNSKILTESVRERHVKTCLEALYYFPHAIEDILKRVAELEDIGQQWTVKILSPVVESVESWLVAERLSRDSDTISPIKPAVKIVGQCMMAVIASRPPPKEQSLLILMRHLRIDVDVLSQYLDPFDSLLLKNLNHFLENTAKKVITDLEKQDQINIVLLTTDLLVKRLKFEHAAHELRNEFTTLRTWFKHRAERGDGKAKENATKLLHSLESLDRVDTDPSQPDSQSPNDEYIAIPMAQDDIP